jgi:electron transfer flavoprotein alpha subunit
MVHEKALRVSRQVYGGKAQATIELKRTPAVLWTRSRSFASANHLSSPGDITELSFRYTNRSTNTNRRAQT